MTTTTSTTAVAAAATPTTTATATALKLIPKRDPDSSPNQTDTVSPILPNSELDFEIDIEQTNLLMPFGVQSYCVGNHKDQWLIITGRSSGLHGFSSEAQNFPASEQNTTLMVINLKKKYTKTRSLIDPLSGLSSSQIDSLSVTNAQFYQRDHHLFIVGGYGADNTQNPVTYGTKPVLTIIDLPKLIDWVENPAGNSIAADAIRQLTNEIFQITGGYMTELENGLSLLVFGQTFEGSYFIDPFTQVYSQQVRRFKIDTGCHDKQLSVEIEPTLPEIPDPNYRRRDLNVVPRVQKGHHGKLIPSLVAYSGVFTLTDGIWTVPVEISAEGDSQMADPENPETFKQGMNNYASAHISMYSKKSGDTYTLFFGGISYGYFENNTFTTDEEIPFINQCTTIRITKDGKYTQYLMDNEYPVITSASSNPGNPLLFGAGAEFLIDKDVKTIFGDEKHSKIIIDYDSLKKKKNLIGHIVGGIASTVPNTSSNTDTFSSPYIFSVWVTK